MEKIVGKDNEKLKLLHKLRQRKYRDETGLFLVENPKIIFDARLIPAIPRQLYVTDDFLQKHKSECEELLSNNVEESYIIPQKLLDRATVLENPQGIIAVYAVPQSKKIDCSKSIVYLNGVSDPGNAGTILRTAAAFGVASIVFDETSVDPYNPKTISAAKEAIFLVNIHKAGLVELAEIAKYLSIYALELSGSKDLQGVSTVGPYCLLLGNEAHGVSQDAKQFVSHSLSIGMRQGSVESLNVGVAGAIAMHHFFTK